MAQGCPCKPKDYVGNSIPLLVYLNLKTTINFEEVRKKVLEDNCQSWLDEAIHKEFSYKAHLELKFQMTCIDGVIFKEWFSETIVGLLSTGNPLALHPSHHKSCRGHKCEDYNLTY